MRGVYGESSPAPAASGTPWWMPAIAGVSFAVFIADAIFGKRLWDKLSRDK
jgi:hypothetical protein